MSGWRAPCPENMRETVPMSESASPDGPLHKRRPLRAGARVPAVRYNCSACARTSQRCCRGYAAKPKSGNDRGVQVAHSGVISNGYVSGEPAPGCTGGVSVLLSAWCRMVVRMASTRSVRARCLASLSAPPVSCCALPDTYNPCASGGGWQEAEKGAHQLWRRERR